MKKYKKTIYFNEFNMELEYTGDLTLEEIEKNYNETLINKKVLVERGETNTHIINVNAINMIKIEEVKK